ncbi:Protein S100-A1 [Liparis tanakae]|uniref:Protein S100-A1 n=1 Tax=Liparis tanakae TaxID=230148 RepID=A0A4Z2FH21_9TELE|nr:Protein S100-A1 [Liparis tanakae]
MNSQLQTAMEGLIEVFHSYSAKEGDKYKLSKLELKSLLQGELADFLSILGLLKGAHDGSKRDLIPAAFKSIELQAASELQLTKLDLFVLPVQASKDPRVVDKIFADLDENKDGEVDFQEFVVLVAALTVACNEFFIDCHAVGGVKSQEQPASKKV